MPPPFLFLYLGMENNIIKKEIIESIAFKNGLILAVGDDFEEGTIFNILKIEGGFEVGIEDGREGWSAYFDEDGNEYLN